MTDKQYVADFLRQAGRSGVKPGLERIQALLAHAGQPHHTFKAIHVAGSNGKGSTATLIARALQAAGFRTGLYTSPHLMHYNERIQIDGRQVSDAKLRLYIDRVQEAIARVTAEQGAPSEFDIGTALAFIHFADEQVDWAVVETGLGGRWDSTNVLVPELSVITHIALDHTNLLGHDVASIAREKAGIIKRGRGVVIGPQPPAAENVLRSVAAANGSPLCAVVAGNPSDAAESGTVTFQMERSDRHGGTVTVQGVGESATAYDYPLLGAYQAENAAVAAAALHWIAKTEPRMTSDTIQQGFSMTGMPGRLELLGGEPLVVLDGAHNVLGVEMMLRSLGVLFPRQEIVFVCGISSDKPAREMLQMLAPAAAHIVATEAAGARLGVWPAAALADMLAEMGFKQFNVIPDAQTALTEARQLAGADGLVCVMGSLYLVGQLRAAASTFAIADSP